MHGSALDVVSCLPAYWRAVVCALVVVTTCARNAFGAGGTEPIRIQYRAAPAAGCPSEADFEAQVFARTASARPATDAEPARTFIVELRQAGGRITGSLVIQETDGATMARRVNGSACEDVATVLALATALAIDPRAELAPDQTLEERRESEPLPEPTYVDSPLPFEPPVTKYGSWVSRWGLGASAAFAAAPRPALGASLLLGLQRRGVLPVGELSLELVYRQTGPEAVRGARAIFHFYALRPAVCITALEFSTWLFAAPCLVLEAGGVTGVGSEIPNSAQRTRFWSTAEVLLRLELALGKRGFLTLEGGVASPLTRYRFVFENPDTSIYQVPAVTATTALRLGTSF